MNGKELQSLRKLLMLDVAEAADLIGNVSARSWQHWEAGEKPVPVDVEDALDDLRDIRIELIGQIDDRLVDGEKLELPYYISFAEFEQHNPGKTKLDWRLSQSVAALYFTEGHAKLI